MSSKPLQLIFLAFFFVFSKPGLTLESTQKNLFKTGSYRQILASTKGQPFILVIWSITCPSCLKDMQILKTIHQRMPRFKFILLTTDALSEVAEVNKILQQQGLTDLESWIFADANTQKLRFEIDPSWYGELPRTYFFNSDHEREGYSGALTHKQFITMISKIL